MKTKKIKKLIFRHEPTFIRKGGTRDWKNYMSREQSDRLDALFRERMTGTIGENWWQSEMCWDKEEEEEIPESAEEIAKSNFLPKFEITRASDNNKSCSNPDDEIYLNGSRRGSFSSVCSFATDRYALVPYFCLKSQKSSESLLSSGYNSVYSSLSSLN